MKTRHQFLKVTATGAIATSFLPAGFDAPGIQSSMKKDRFTLGIAGYTFAKHSIDTAISMMKRVGVYNLSIKGLSSSL